MATQIYKQLDSSWVKVSDLFTLSSDTSYVIEPEHGRALMLLSLASGSPVAGTIGHMVSGPQSITISDSYEYWIRAWPQEDTLNVLLTPSVEYASPVVDGRNHYTGTALDTIWQDPNSPPVDLYFIQDQEVTTTLTADSTLYGYSLTVVSTTGYTVGDDIVILSSALEGRAFFTRIASIPDSTHLTMTQPLDYAFLTGAEVNKVSKDMAVNGASTTQVFSLRGVGSVNLALTLDITRFIIRIICTNAPILDSFGDIANGLTNGVTLRRNGSFIQNLWTIRDNSDLAILTYDTTFFDPTHPLNVNGIISRCTYAGPAKRGVALRVLPDDDLELLVADDLSSLISFEVHAQGHLVTD